MTQRGRTYIAAAIALVAILLAPVIAVAFHLSDVAAMAEGVAIGLVGGTLAIWTAAG